jgi:catechol 2,3-dioxygenase-like lactoylglutathione lyase family enzyme
MQFVGDIHIYVSDFERARRFWAGGLQLEIAEQQVSPHSAFARLNFPDGGPSIRIIAPSDPWPADTRPPPGSRPTITFDITTTNFDDTLIRLMEHGGRQIDEIETYGNLRAVTVADPDGNTFELLEIRDDLDPSDD